MVIIDFIGKVFRAVRSYSPGELMEIMGSLWRGFTLQMRHVLNPRVRFGRFFRRDCRVVIRGPGSVEIGDHVQFMINTFQGVTIITTSAEARVVIGDRSLLGGVRIVADSTVEIGSDCLLANSLITDRDFHGDDSEEPQPISVGDGCWLCGSTSVLKGSTLGIGGVVGVGSVLAGRTVAEAMMVVGVPGRPVVRLRG